jgi:FtsH-binding integral membrane protein
MDAWTSNTVQAADRVSAFLWKVYGWMAIGLGLTALVAFAVAGSPDLLRVLIGNRLVFFGLVIVELGLVFSCRPELTGWRRAPQPASSRSTRR